MGFAREPHRTNRARFAESGEPRVGEWVRLRIAVLPRSVTNRAQPPGGV